MINKKNKKTQLLCTFTNRKNLDKIIKNIRDTYILQYNKIIVIKNVNDIDELYCIYNIIQKWGIGQLNNTILIHRKREFNTLYTINSLNTLIKNLNDGKKDSNFIVPWKNYKNTFLLNKLGVLKVIKTKLKDVVKVD